MTNVEQRAEICNSTRARMLGGISGKRGEAHENSPQNDFEIEIDDTSHSDKIYLRNEFA